MELALFGELKRRRVFRAVAGYGVAAFLVLQIIEPVVHGLHWPDAVVSGVVVGLAVGFPVVVCLAWVFDVNAGVVERTAPAAGLKRRDLVMLAAVATGLAAVPVAWHFGARASSVGRERREPSIAVLPFADMSASKDQEYFGDGVAEEILNALAHVKGIRVIGRTSSFSFKGKNTDLRVIGRELNVAAILEGSVRRAGDRIRVTTQLISAEDGADLWSEVYDRQLADVFSVQDEIAQAVVAALRVKLLPQPLVASERRTNPEAYNQYLIGRQLSTRVTLEGARRAMQAFEKAIHLDPAYAPAWAGLAHAGFWVWALTGDTPTRAIEAAEKTIALAPDLADGWAVRGALRSGARFDFAGARADLERALVLNPSDTGALRWMATTVLLPLGQLDDGIAAAKKATELDPLVSEYWSVLGASSFLAGRMDEARKALDRATEISPDNQWAIFWRSLTDVVGGQPGTGLTTSERLQLDWMRLTAVAVAQHSLGHSAESQRALDALVSARSDTAAYQIAEIHGWVGEPDRAFEWLDKAYALKDGGLLFLKNDPLLGSLHSDARFPALLRRLNLPAD